MAKKVAINAENTYFLDVEVTSAGFSRKDGETSVYLSGKPDADLSDVIAAAFKGVQSKWLPKWYKEEREYMTFKSTYRVPVRLDYDNKAEVSFEEWCNLGVKNAKATIKVKIFGGACYLNAVVVREPGEEYDPFADFDL